MTQSVIFVLLFFSPFTHIQSWPKPASITGVSGSRALHPSFTIDVLHSTGGLSDEGNARLVDAQARYTGIAVGLSSAAPSNSIDATVPIEKLTIVVEDSESAVHQCRYYCAHAVFGHACSFVSAQLCRIFDEYVTDPASLLYYIIRQRLSRNGHALQLHNEHLSGWRAACRGQGRFDLRRHVCNGKFCTAH